MADSTRWLTGEEQRTWRAFWTAGRLVDSTLDRQLNRSADMGHAHYAILVALSEAEDGTVRMGDLAEFLQYSPSRLSHAVRRMEGTGWIVRRPCPTDRRGQLAVITPAGRAAIHEAAPGHVDEVRSLVFDVLDETQQAQLREICETIVERVAHRAAIASTP